MEYLNDDKYDGEWVKGLRHGKNLIKDDRKRNL